MLARTPTTGNPVISASDLLRRRITARLAKVGLSANKASAKAGLGKSYVNDILSGSSNNPARYRLESLADVLECDLEYLTGEQETPRKSPNSTAERAESDDGEPASVPVYAVGLPDSDGFFGLATAPNEFVSLGSAFGAAESYAVIVPDDSSAPRYFAGEIVIATANRLASRGAFAVLRMKDGRAAIRRIDSITGESVNVTAIGGSEQAVTIPRESVEAIHRIVGTVELVR